MQCLQTQILQSILLCKTQFHKIYFHSPAQWKVLLVALLLLWHIDFLVIPPSFLKAEIDRAEVSSSNVNKSNKRPIKINSGSIPIKMVKFS